MSYILEALKKSEEKRRREESFSALLEPQNKPHALRKARSRSGLWFWLLPVFFLIIFLPAGWYYYENKPNISSQVAEQTQEDNLSRTVEPSSLAEPPSENVIPELRPKGAKIAIVEDEEGTSAADTVLAEILEPRPLSTQEELVVTELQEKEEKIPFLDELSPTFSQAVPKFHLAGHVYSSDPLYRLIIINNNIVREGDIVEKDFILDEITPDGVILKTGTIRFRLNTRK